MPDFSFTPPPPMNVNFITGNPALDAYLKANKATSEQESRPPKPHI